jgi:hypothetical protein
MGKDFKVPVQKGPIVADQRTMKHSTRAEVDVQDYANRLERFDGMTLKFHTPKR